MKISLVIPTYNMVGKVNYCLNSLVNQTILQNKLAELEVIAVDDCSTDSTWEILADYEKRYPHIIKAVHSPENHRQGGARNLGFSLSTGEYIGMIDADDWVAPDFCEKLLRKSLETGADLVACGYRIVHDHESTGGAQLFYQRVEKSILAA